MVIDGAEVAYPSVADSSEECTCKAVVSRGEGALKGERLKEESKSRRRGSTEWRS